MSISAVLFLLTTFLINCVTSDNLAYTIESTTYDGTPCLNDCNDQGECWTSWKKKGNCFRGWKTAYTYYTSRKRYPEHKKCLSKCDFFGDDFSWCYIDNDYNWDYCSPKTDPIGKWYQYTLGYGRCKNECGYADGSPFLWCKTYWSAISHWWDKCEEIYYYEEDTQTAYNKPCFGNCKRHDGDHYWCYDENESKEYCAPNAVRFVCPSSRSRRSPPRKTVAEYNQDINNDVSLNTTVLSTVNNPDDRNPVLDYTFRELRDGTLLPYRIRALIRPAPFHHLQDAKSRKSSDISYKARKNCKNMGYNRCMPNRNNDQCGHLVPYIVGGPADWFNVASQTQRINIGTVTNTDVDSPSIWSGTERIVRNWVEDGGYVHFEVLVAYNLTVCTRPTGFGVIERYYDSNGAFDHECSGYWYSNDPYEDPDEWNN